MGKLEKVLQFVLVSSRRKSRRFAAAGDFSNAGVKTCSTISILFRGVPVKLK